ncbi:MAG TPA: GNAT family N-acetyltransferase [Actinomycetales bacterium]|nr:GNAT family N-acetyltransferase [Actinomycetales bacterium]
MEGTVFTGRRHGRYELRRATDRDVPAIADLYRSLSPESMHLRFNGRVSAERLHQLAQLGPAEDVAALVAVLDGKVVAEARYELLDSGGYEFGLVIADAEQKRGLGEALLQALREMARAEGIEALHAVVRVDNTGMLKLLQRTGSAVVEPADGDVLELDVATDDYMPGWSTGPVDSPRRWRVLVESRGIWQTPETRALRAAGYDVRQCMGPSRTAGRPCPLLALGRCRLVEEADAVACLLPDADPDALALMERHAADRGTRLVATNGRTWRQVAPVLARAVE